MKQSKRRYLLAAVLAFVFVCLSCAACVPTSVPGPSDSYEFVFNGTGVFADGNEYDIVIHGNDDAGKTFRLGVDQIPALELDGTWVFVEGKGYKLYFNDTSETYVYTRYDPQTKEFSFQYTLNLSGGLGEAKVKMTAKDEAFAAEYDGKGLPAHPPTFTGVGWGGGSGTMAVASTLVCNEDGTCISIASETGAPNRTGTWTYDEARNVYSFVFDDETYPTNYLKPHPESGKSSWRHSYGAIFSSEAGNSKYIDYIVVEDFETQPQFTDATWHYDENGEKVYIPFETTYDEATKTYTLIYEALAKNMFLDRIVTYTVDE